MAYKTIIVQVDDSRHLDARVEAAAAIAAAHKAHLIGAALSGVANFLYQTVAVAPDYPDLASYVDLLRRRAESALAKFDNTCARLGVASSEKRIVDDEAAGGISMQARYSDLLVLGQIDPDDPDTAVAPDFPEYAALHCGVPALMIPYADRAGTIGRKATIAWNASIEATRAVHYAIPLLQQAQSVEAVIFNADGLREDEIGAPPGADLKAYLARHGVAADIIVETTDLDVGDALLAFAGNTGADLIVMGCYGHSRFRELVLGGATRSIVKKANVPVLMSH